MAPVHNKSIHLPLLFTLLSLSLSPSPAAARRDSITPTQPLADNETLVSANGTFALGFFTPNNSDRRYIGIWYYNETIYQRKVWVANRDRPAFGSTGQLSVAANGTITITDRDSTHVVWYVDTNFIGLSNPVVQLLDTGNFVLREDQGYYNIQEYYLWQSFDYPTDTLLPGMKLGLNRRLPAWRSDDDPSPGDYCAAMVVDDRPEMYVFNRSSKLWRSGPWDGKQLGSITQRNIPNAGGFAYSFVNTSEEVAFQVGAQTILMVGTSGLLQMQGLDSGGSGLFWQSQENECDNIGWCGSNAICDSTESPNICRCLGGFTPKNPANSTGGCVRRQELDCRNGTAGFLAVNGVKLPVSSISLDSLISLDVCRSKCLKNCSCVAFALISGGGGGCVIWVTDLLDVVQFNSTKQFLYIRIGGSRLIGPHSQSHNANGRTVAIIVSVISGALLFSCFIFFIWRRKKRGRGRTYFFYDKLDEDDRRKDLDLLFFNFGTIAAATESFSAKNKLGQGGFGPVYKGILGGDKEIAVKRLAKSSQQGAEEFKNEVILIAKLQNRNLVRLLGYCIQGEERMLIYEYMSNKSLDAFLFGIILFSPVIFLYSINIVYYMMQITLTGEHVEV